MGANGGVARFTNRPMGHSCRLIWVWMLQAPEELAIQRSMTRLLDASQSAAPASAVSRALLWWRGR